MNAPFSKRKRRNVKTVNIEPGQIWRDKDKRREEAGSVREFRILATDGGIIWCVKRESKDETPQYGFARSRFGSGRANDSFELVSEKEQR
jgi:hypothetical protein